MQCYNISPLFIGTYLLISFAFQNELIMQDLIRYNPMKDLIRPNPMKDLII